MRLAIVILLAAGGYAQNRAPGLDSIRREEMRADLFFLASDAMRGRLTNTPEYAIAAEWIASRFARMGLAPLAPADSYFQRFDLVTARLGDPNRLHIGPPESRRNASLGEEFYPLHFSGSGEARGRAILVGYGITAPEHSWDDYGSSDAKGAIVLVFDGDPNPDDPSSPFDGLVTSEYASSLRKTLLAQEHGAAAVLVISSRSDRDGPRSFAASGPAYWPKVPSRIERYELASRAERVRIPALQISTGLAEHILGTPLEPLRTRAASGGKSVHAAAAQPVELAASVARGIVADRNIVAKIDGADPKLKSEGPRAHSPTRK